jgi:hypothetical protein
VSAVECPLALDIARMIKAPCSCHIERSKVSLRLIKFCSKIESSITEESADEEFFCDKVENSFFRDVNG